MFLILYIKPYRRENAVLYARKWAFSQNPLFGDYGKLGGNCTNFVSQCVYAGACRMNYTPVFGWYYISDEDRSASWTGVDFFYNFIIGNSGVGPWGEEVSADMIESGDVIQLGREGEGYYHSLLVVGFEGDVPLIAAQTDNALDRALDSYTYDYARYIKIRGVRVKGTDTSDCFESVYEGKAISTGMM